MKSLLLIFKTAIKFRLFSFVKSLMNLCFFSSLNPLLFQKIPLILNTYSLIYSLMFCDFKKRKMVCVLE
jgi:hypothetical protein